MNQSEWRKLVEQHFDFLILNHGFKITSDKYYEESFGTRTTILETERYRITIELDRGSLLTVNSFAKDRQGFFGYMTSILEHIKGKPTRYYSRRDLDGVEQLIYYAQLFRENEVVIFNFFQKGDWQETKQNYKDDLKKRVSELLGKDLEELYTDHNTN